MKQVHDELIRRIVDALVQAINPAEIYLFGSQATGRTHQHSDIDLFIVVDDDAGDLHELTGRSYLALPRDVASVDLIVCYRKDMHKWASVRFSLPYEVAHNGKRLYAA